MAELKFTKDQVPIYDGSPDLYVAYRRAALVYAETVEWKKKPLIGPRLQAALEGSARTAVEHMPPGWVSHDRGAVQLLDFLKSQMKAPTLAEAGRSISRFFYGIKRRRGEGMSSWIVRHDEALLEARRTLAEAIQEYGQLAIPSTMPSSTAGRPWYRAPMRPTSTATHRSMTSSPGLGFTSHEEDTQVMDESRATGQEAPSNSEEPEDDESRSETHWSDWGSWNYRDWPGSWWSDHWSHSGSWWSSDRSKEDWSRQSWEVSTSASQEAERFLPDFVVAWMLLQRSGLEVTDRSVIVANLKNQFTTARVKEALKLTWPDEELKRRDAGRGSALLAQEDIEVQMAEQEQLENNSDWEATNDEDQLAYQALEEEARMAFVAMQGARRTLRDAREKQAMMRKNRNFYPIKSGQADGSRGDRPPPKCFRCGGPHLKRDCPEPAPGDGREQRAHFVFSAFQEPAAPEPGAVTDLNSPPALRSTRVQTGPEMSMVAADQTEFSMMALERVIAEGKAIIDGGATSSLGSTEALERIGQLNWRDRGEDGIAIMKGDTPSFRFGNNGRQSCISTALVDVMFDQQPGQMKIHLHEIPGQPVLLGIQALRRLGAVIDFGSDQALFKGINPCKVVQLETTESGHQLLPLTADVMSGAFVRAQPFRSLSTDGGMSSLHDDE